MEVLRMNLSRVRISEPNNRIYKQECCISFNTPINLQSCVVDVWFFVLGLLDTVRNCTYIGMADYDFVRLQHNTNLYLANVVNLSKQVMYQLVLQRFSHFNAI